MAVVVSDTSPIRALTHIGCVTLLEDLYREVLVPPAVAQELMHPPHHLPPVDVKQFTFVRVQMPIDLLKVQQLLQTLHLGESEALVLALEVQAAAILVDEKGGRRVAANWGLVPIGTLGILLEAKRAGFVSIIGPLIDQLQQTLNFFVSPQLKAQVLKAAGE